MVRWIRRSANGTGRKNTTAGKDRLGPTGRFTEVTDAPSKVEIRSCQNLLQRRVVLNFVTQTRQESCTSPRSSR